MNLTSIKSINTDPLFGVFVVILRKACYLRVESNIQYYTKSIYLKPLTLVL